MSGKSFVHAHVHTDYSALDGAAKIQSLVEKVVELGQPGVAVTDHGNAQGTHELWKVAKEHDINAILGQEFYVAPSGYSRTYRSPVFYGDSWGEDKKERSNDVSGNGAYTHMTIWAENNDGKFNLFKLSTLAYLEGKYMKPRIDVESLSEYSKGLIGTTGCPSGEIQTRLRLGQWDEAIKYASQMQDILGKDNYYCEIMDHGLEIERVVKPDLLRLSKELKIPLIATNDTHYVSSDQVESHDHLLCISGGSTIDAEKRFKFSGNSYYIKSAEEMRELFKDHPEACDNTLELNERCNVSFDENADLMPKYDVPEGTTDKEFLSQEVIRLIPNRVAKWDTMDEEKQNIYFKQAEYECGIINLMGFASYFLVVADFVQWAKDNKIAVGPGRGCLTEETNVLTPQGYVEIKTIKPGDEVYDTEGTIVVVPETFAYPVEDENLITLSTENGTKKSLTVDHKILVKKTSAYGNNTEWIKAKDLIVGDKMVIPKRNLSKNPARAQSAKDLGELVALLHARTTYQGTQVRFDDVDSANRAKSLFKSAYNRELKSEEHTVIDDSALAYLADQSLDDTLNGLLHQDKNHHQALGFVTGLASLGYVGYLDNDQYKIFEQVSKGVGAYFSDGVALCLEDNGSDAFYNEIISIQSDSYEGEVYDFTVPTTHSYVTDSGIVHNSAGGCLVAYALSITDLDPIKHGLIFERFLNPDRVSMPDIDIDFDDKRRGEVIEYVTNKYGQDKVSQIITYTMIKAKSALKDATRILDFPYALGDTLSKKLPPDVAGKGMKLYEIYDVDHERYGEAEDFRGFIEKGTALFSPQMCKRVLEVALGIEGYLRTTGIHAAGVIMSSHPIAGIIPMMDPSTADKESSKEDKKKKKKKKTEEAPVLTTVTQYDYPTCESLGLLKMDFLGLRNLTIITDALSYVKENHGVEMTLDDIIHSELDDKKTYELLQRGEASSIFQLESAGMRSLLKSMAPTGFNDIVAVLALYRPGPMGMDSHIAYADRKNDREPVTPIHPELEEPLKEILGETFGLIIYQEQIMQIAQKVAGYSLAQADLLRRAMGKKKKSELDKQEENFVNGMKERGYSKEAFQALWDTLLPFADYAFNKCVAGDTQVKLSASGSDSNGYVTVEELYNRLHVDLLPPSTRWEGQKHTGACLHCKREDRPAMWRGRCKACKSWYIKFNNSGLKAMSMDSDGRIRPRRVKDVHYNGEKEAFKVTLSDGKHITSTFDHRHMTPDGWKQVVDLNVGDLLLTMGGVDNAISSDKYNYRLTEGEKTYAGSRLPTQERVREDSVGYIDGGSVLLKEWTETQEWSCTVEGCDKKKESGDRIERAHLDGDRTNNDPSNLKMMCVSHHKKWDYENNGRLRRNQVGNRPIPVEIVSIENVGTIPVYDLEMDSDAGNESVEHSWVGNGIVTHNSHSAGYALLSYTTAYLKAHYPEEYMAAVLTSVSGTPDKTAIYLNECKKMGIEVNPPSISLSDKNYSAKMKKILFGLNSVRGLGEQTVDDILKYRTQTNYCSVPSMLENLPVGALNKKVFEGLIFGGALDEFGYTRRGLNENLVPMLSNVKKRRNEQEDGEVSLFEAYEVELPEIHIPDVREYSKKEKLSRERHILGLYLSDHPLSSMGATLESQADRTILDIRSNPPRESSDFGAGEKTVIAGVITSAVEKTTRKGEKMLTATVEDVTGEIDIIAFPKTYKAMGEIVQDDIYKIAGTIRNEEDRGISMIVDSYETLEIDEETGKVPMWLKMYDKEATEDSVDELKEILQRNPGETPVRVSMKRSDGSVVNIRLGSEYTVKSSPVFSQKLMALFGSKIFGKW